MAAAEGFEVGWGKVVVSKRVVGRWWWWGWRLGGLRCERRVDGRSTRGGLGGCLEDDVGALGWWREREGRMRRGALKRDMEIERVLWDIVFWVVWRRRGGQR